MSDTKGKNHSSKSILIVDDNIDFLNMLKAVLSSSGYDNILLCNDPRLVLDILKKTMSDSFFLIWSCHILTERKS